MKRLLLALALAPCPAAAQERPADYRYSAPLQVDGAGSHYRFALPPAAYRGTQRADLGDLRVFNAAGEPVPYALADRDAKRAAPPVQAVNMFPLHGDQANGLERATVRVERNGGGSVINISVAGAPSGHRRVLLGYILDAAELKSPQQALLLHWKTSQGFSGQARVEGSDDLKHWRTLSAGAPLLHLEHGGARLERRRVELGGAHARYLRLSFSGVPSDFALTGVELELRPDKPQPAREWLSLAAAQGKEPGELLFDTAGHFPVERVRLHLPQPNTVVRVQLLSRQQAGEKWRPVAYATAYRLGREGGDDIVSPDIVTPPVLDRYWMVKVDQKGGGAGAGSVRMDVAWVPHEVVFVARGDGPFLLAYGNGKAKSGALPLGTVLPRRDEHPLTHARAASVGEVSGAAPAAPSLLAEPGRFLSHLADNREFKKWVLWGALVIGVLLLAGMAFRLLRNLGGD
jgi:hypothetical protein